MLCVYRLPTCFCNHGNLSVIVEWYRKGIFSSDIIVRQRSWREGLLLFCGLCFVARACWVNLNLRCFCLSFSSAEIIDRSVPPHPAKNGLLKPEAVFCRFQAGGAFVNSSGYHVNVTARTSPSGLGQWEARRPHGRSGRQAKLCFWVKLGCSAWREVVRSCVHVWGTRLECFEKKSQGAVDQICQTGVKGGVVSIAESWFHLNTEIAPGRLPWTSNVPRHCKDLTIDQLSNC